jgi:hypothetical protein
MSVHPQSPRRAGLWRRGALAAALVLAGAVAPVLAQPAAPAAAPLPVETFYRNADMVGAKLSDTGKRLAVALTHEGRVALGVVDLQTGSTRLVAGFDDADVRTFEWLGDDRLVFNIVDREGLLGAQKFSPGLFVVNADGTHPQQLIRLVGDAAEAVPGWGSSGRDPLPARYGLLAVPDAGNGEEVVVGRWDWIGDKVTEVRPMLMNVVTLRTRVLDTGAPEGITDWLFDPAGVPRVGSKVKDGEALIYWHGPGDAAWRLLAKRKLTEESWQLHSVDSAGQLYVVDPEGAEGVAVLKKFDFEKNAPAAQALVRAKGFDFDGRLVNEPGKGPVLGVQIGRASCRERVS